MGFFKKLLAGGLGWTLGGPLGAVICVIIASYFDNDKTNEYQKVGDSYTSRNNSHGANDFQIALLVLIAGVMKADGNVVKGELAAVKRFLVSNYGEDGALEALQMLKELLKKNIDVSQIAIQCGVNLSYSARLQMLHMLFNVAAGDGEVVSSEVEIIERIARYMDVNDADIASIEAIYSKKTNKEWAYQVLEIPSDSSDEEVKKAYRRMAMKYHPDKVNMLGEEVKKSATEKFRQVKEAYDEIKKQRGF